LALFDYLPRVQSCRERIPLSLRRPEA
jgi:hypothetical protein